MGDDEKHLIAGVPRESFPGENRVALVPASLAPLIKAGLDVSVEAGAGVAAGFPDADYRSAGATIVDRDELFRSANFILQVRAAGANPVEGAADLLKLRSGQVLIGFCDPLSAPQTMSDLAQRGVICLALELVPRITRAQSMDALSSMATVAGYKAALIAANALPRMFPMLMTAAGTVAPARVFVVGAGVAGLQAIATSRRLGAVVQAYDVRTAAQEEVRSLGAKFVELPLEVDPAEQVGGYARAMDEAFYRRQREMMLQVVAASDVVIPTAAVPGKPAPRLITAEMVHAMAPGSVIVDLAAERGGNCELTRPGETIVEQGVTIIGPVNLPSMVPYHASQMFARNMATLLLAIVRKGRLHLDLADEIIRETLVTREHEVIHPKVRELLGMMFTMTSDVGSA